MYPSRSIIIIPIHLTRPSSIPAYTAADLKAINAQKNNNTLFFVVTGDISAANPEGDAVAWLEKNTQISGAEHRHLPPDVRLTCLLSLSTMYDLTVIIPTFNEEANIRNIVMAVDAVFHEHSLHGQILVVDDNSSDATISIVQDLMRTNENVEILVREKDHGLSQSVADGFCHANIRCFYRHRC